MAISISRQQGRRFLLHHQLLYPPYQLSGKHAVSQVFERLRLIQYDPLNPCGRNPDLVLQSRIADYQTGNFSDWLGKNGIEGYDKVLCLMPIEDHGFLHFGRGSMYRDRREFAAQHRADLDKVIARIRTDGPVPTNGITDDRQVDIGWYGPNAWGKVALETLWRLGELMVVRSASGRKMYDLPERVYRDRWTNHQPTIGEHIRRRVKSVGLLPANGSGTGWLGIGLGRTIRPEIKKLIETKQLLEVTVGDIPGSLVMRPEDLPELEDNSEIEPQMTFIAPLDNLTWDRNMIEQLFGFFYRWEVYVPPAKRQYGYYVLPILYGDRLIGRIEPVMTKDKKLRIKGLWKENEAEWGSEEESALRLALKHFQTYLGADEIVYS